MGVRTVIDSVGFGRSEPATFTIPNGANGSAVTPVDLGRGYAMIVVRLASLTGVPAGATLSARVAEDDADAACTLWAIDGASAWSSGVLSGTSARFVLSTAAGAQRIGFTLSANATADVAIQVYGFDPTVDG